MRRTPFAVLAAFAAAFLFHCSAGDEAPAVSSCEEAVPTGVVYPDDHRASDEAFVHVWEARCRASKAKGWVLAAPEEGAAVPAAAPVELRWELATSTAGFLGLGFGVERALAHVPPITGDVHLIELAPAGGGTPLYVFTADTSWTPGVAEWSRLVAMKDIAVTIWSAHFEKGVILDPADGPFVSPRVGHFSVEGP